MKILDYLFYNGYLLGKMSKNFDDFPVVVGALFMWPPVLLNVFAVSLLLEAWGVFNIESKVFDFILTFAVIFILIFYYQYKGRYKKIVEKYEQKKERILIHPIIVYIISIVISCAFGTLAGMYRNKDWIFG